VLEVNRLEIKEVGVDEPFKVVYESNPEFQNILWLLASSSIVEFINDSDGYNRYQIEIRVMREMEPNSFAYMLQVRKIRDVV